MSRCLDQTRINRMYKIIFDLISEVNSNHDLELVDSVFLTETLKEELCRVEHHELGPSCPGMDIDFIETSWGQIAAVTLKCRDKKPLRPYDRGKALIISEALAEHYKRPVPLLIESLRIDTENRTVGITRDIEWANKRIKRLNIDKETWKKFQKFIRNFPSESDLYCFFGSIEGWTKTQEVIA